MIHIFFVPGMFGSTLEYVLRSYTKEYNPVTSRILPDGSMHSFDKEWHPLSITEIAKFNGRVDSITTPIYPFKQNHLPEILLSYESLLKDNSSILIYADSVRSAEINMLFQYYKIAIGVYNMGLEIFCGNNSKNIVNWNSTYQSWKDMQIWELREWLSLFYPGWVREWIDSNRQVPDTFLKIKNTDVLYNTKETLLKIINFCNLTVQGDIDSFITEWKQKQNYAIDEFQLLNQVVEHALNKISFKWNNLNIISEAIIQQRLREKGFEIRCDGLNTFPTDSITLYNLLEKC